MQNIAHFQADEPPTVRRPHVNEAITVAIRRADRAIEVALERLLISPDEDAVAAVVSDLITARDALATVLT